MRVTVSAVSEDTPFVQTWSNSHVSVEGVALAVFSAVSVGGEKWTSEHPAREFIV